MTEVVLREIADRVAVLTLNRPERLNAWTPEMGSAYFDLLDDCAGRDDVRVIVVTGAGRGFCAGADIADLEAVGAGEVDGADRRADPRPQTHPLTVPRPIVAAINGPCATRSAPSSMAAMKRQVYADLDRDLDAALAEANRLMGESLRAPDFVEGVKSFVERREPSFAPLSADR
jgi:enoyl-CoA hydratase/carnithine racemase